MSEYDSPWKEGLDAYFPALAELLFPRVGQLIDWTRGYEPLDTELQQVTRDAALGGRQADRLYKVWLKDGAEVWILIHIEVQSQKDEAFAERVYVYHYRIYDRFRRPVISLAILADEHRDWRPSHFGYDLGGCALKLEFPIAKLIDFATEIPVLETSLNPFAPIIIAHLKTQETRRDPDSRYGWKRRLVRGLYERGFSADDIRKLFRLIDWMMDLPRDLERQFWKDLEAIEREKHMPYVTSIERIAREEGLAEGKTQGEALGKAESLLRILEHRYATVPADLARIIRSTRNLGSLDRWIDLAFEAKTLEQFRRDAGIVSD